MESSNNKDKVKPIKETVKDAAATAAKEVVPKTPRDWGRVAFFTSILSVVLVIILFYAVSRNLSGLDQRFGEVDTLKNELAAVDNHFQSSLDALDNRVDIEAERVLNKIELRIIAMNGRIGKIEAELNNLDGLNAHARKIIMASLIQQSAEQIGYLAEHVETPVEAKALMEAQKILEEVQAGVKK